MREKTLGGSTLTNGAGLTVILSVDVKTTTQIRKKKKKHEIRKKWKPVEKEADSSAVRYSLAPPAFPGKIKKNKKLK